MREEHTLTYDTTIEVTRSSLLDGDNNDMPVAEIIMIIVIIGIVVALYKKGKLPIISKKP